MRDISMERVNETRKNILEIIESATLTHEQKLTCLANQADSLMEVLDLPEGLDELLNVPIDRKCICDLSEGHAPMRPRYIIPDYAKFLKEGSKFLQLDPPTDLYEALNSLMIFYKHVPSVTNYPVYVGQLDELLEPYIDTVDEAQAKKMLKLFLTQMDRTILDSFSHANIGPRETKAGRLLLEAEKELEKVDIQDEVTEEVCDVCGRNMVIKYGPHGRFLACPGFPECRNTKPYYEKIGVACPKCGKEIKKQTIDQIVDRIMELPERTKLQLLAPVVRGRKGRKYYGCEDNPECDFMSWQKPSDKKCPVCGSYMIEKGNKLVCSQETCGYVEAKTKEED